RLAEAAILSATGFRRRQILGLMSAEALLISVAGAIPGLALGILYNRLLVAGLNSLWKDAVNASVIFVQVKPLTLAAGALSGIATSLAVMLAVLWRSLRNPLATMVKDEIPAGDERPLRKIRRSLPALAAVACTGASLVLIAAMLATAQTMNVPVFLGAGALLLAGGLLLLRMFLTHMAAKKAEDIPRFLPLALKNISVNRDRTLAVVTLLSLGVFSVVITGANRKTFYGLESDRGSGTGGFILWSESSLPVMNDLNTPAGVKTYSLEDEPLLEGVHYVQMIRLNGEDASCLNLNRVRQPVILGVPAGYFDRVHAFGFASLIPETDREHPWKALQKRRAPDMIDGFADQEAITWSLGKKPGDTLFYRDERGKILKIRIAGGLENSVFQGNILVSDSLLHLFYPSAGGSRVMLVDGPAARRDSIAGRLEVLFRDHGMSVIPTPERLAAFNAVQNTYLSVFMMLGGLGVITGTIGLGVVILQNLRRRKREFALYLAMGFTRKFILRLILTEHLLMLLAGFFLGILSAAAGILPSLLSPGYTLPGIFLSAILLAILLNGLLWIWLPARQAMKKNVMEGVREE
ncbi:MAG TPA: ABC transporter permease, partial [Bacteroidales bacterium]|nr:ABC transporter permease [Bacteroidales bacterium]